MELLTVRDRLIVELLDSEEKSPGGIILARPDDVAEGIMIACGADVLSATTASSIEESFLGLAKIYFNRKAGIPIVIAGKKLMAIRAADILCIEVPDIDTKSLETDLGKYPE